MATHSSILAWEISWTGKLGGLQSMIAKIVGHDRVTKQQQRKQTDRLNKLLCRHRTDYQTLKYCQRSIFTENKLFLLKNKI